MKKIKKLKDRFLSLPKHKKIQVTISMVLTLALMISLPVLAWFANNKEIGTMVKVNAPTVLTIGAGANDASDMIDLANINVEKKNSSGGPILEGDYVFAVRGKYLSYYDLQIARTTNIPFDYEIYRVSAIADSSEESLKNGFGTISGSTADSLKSSYKIAEYKSSDGKIYYYPYVLDEQTNTESSDYQTYGKISGGYLNDKEKSGTLVDTETIGDGDKTLDDGTYHSHNYETYSNVNEYAEPLYWQAVNLPINAAGRSDNGDFVDYYVLKIKWTSKFYNSKETDMIYITAQRH